MMYSYTHLVRRWCTVIKLMNATDSKSRTRWQIYTTYSRDKKIIIADKGCATTIGWYYHIVKVHQGLVINANFAATVALHNCHKSIFTTKN